VAKQLKIFVLMTLISWLSVVMVSSVEAVSVSSKPSAPQIVSITASKTSSTKKVNVTVAFTKATTNAKSPLLYTEVKIGSASCRALKNASKCTLKNISSKKVLQVFARAKNRNGFGGYGPRISFATTVGNKWNRNTTNGGGSPSATSPVSPSVTSPVSGSSLKFNLRNAIGLTLRSNVSSMGVRKTSTGSNLQIIDSNGVSSDAVISGNASIRNMFIAPNDKLYVVFSSRTLIGSSSCLLAEIEKLSGEPKCIESDLSSIAWPTSNSSFTSDPIQFDDSGAIYFAGMDTSGKSVLRRFRDSSTVSLITDNVSSLSFLALPDGRVLIGGRTTSSGTNWTRLVTASGGLQNLVAGDFPRFLSKFPDGNIYLGFWGNDGLANMGVKRFISSSGAIDPVYWISGNTNGVSRNAVFDVGANYSTPQRIPALEPFYGTVVRQLVTTSDNKIFAITGTTPTLVQYYPNVAKTTTAVTSVNVMQRVLSYVIMSGTNTSGQNIMTLYNTNTDSEVTLIPGTNEIEVYRLNYVASSNKIMFDGLRFSDNKYVLGQVDLNTMNVTTSQTGSSKLVDFQTFGS
jgi:hypothetical protein